MFTFTRFGFRNLGWRGRLGFYVAVALGLALILALVILSLGLSLILLPVVAVALAVGRWRLSKLRAEAGTPSSGAADRIIEIDYQVIDKPRPGRR